MGYRGRWSSERVDIIIKIMKNIKIAIIGAGHMGVSIFRGLKKYGNLPSGQFILSSPNPEKLSGLQQEFGVRLTKVNTDAVEKSDIIFIVVRPRIVAEVIREIKDIIRGDQIIISVAACIPIRLLEIYLGTSKFKIIRIMPNVPVSEGKGIIGWLPNINVKSNDREIIQKLLSVLGILVECKDDNQLDKLSMISGCGPGYVGYFMRCLQMKAVQYGFSEADAYTMVMSTFSGTIHNLETKNETFQELVKSIATKGGITEEVLKNLDCNKFPVIFGKSIDHGYDKIKNIEKELEELK